MDRRLEKPPVLLLGDGPTALSALQSLTQPCEVVGVLRAVGDQSDDPVREFAGKRRVPVWSLNSVEELSSLISSLRPAAVVISSFNRLLPPDILAANRFINVHYSPLPRYRGRANVNWAIINGEVEAAISIHFVAPGLDVGNILFQELVTIFPVDTAQSIYEQLNAIQERELGAAVIRAISGDPGRLQDNSQATYGCARLPNDGEIDWTRSAVEIDRLIRALSAPFLPGAFTYLQNRRIVIARAEPRENAPVYAGAVPGRVANRSTNDGWVDVLTGEGILRLLDVIPDNVAGVTKAASVIRSTRDTLGLSCRELLGYIGALERRVVELERSGRAARADPDLRSLTPN